MTTGPLAFSGSRLSWGDLPRAVRARIAELAGAQVVTETAATSGFSPGYAARLELGDGTEVFVKAVSPAQNPDSPALARAEVTVAALLPPTIPAPALLWSADDGEWVLLGFEAVDGSAPEQPWQPDELRRVLHALTALASQGTPAPPGLRPLAEDVAAYARCWTSLADRPDDLARAVAAVGEHGPWLAAHLDEVRAWASGGPAAASGDTLVHGDLRADNVILDDDGAVWLIDWPHATGAGTPWYDLLAMLPSVAMQHGGDPQAIFWSQPTTSGVDRCAVRAVLAAVTGYLLHGAVQPPPPGIANLRPFQLAQAVAALDWLRRV